jgi:nucleotide-binding universal stress UspA family protein
VFNSGPQKCGKHNAVKHILVPFTGTCEEQQMLTMACALAKAYKATLSVIYVLEVPMNLPIDAETFPGVDEANAILDKAEDIARSVGYKITTDLLQARDAGRAIVQEASDRSADLILIEARQRIELGVLCLGENVDYVLKHAPCAVWVSRLPSACSQ